MFPIVRLVDYEEEETDYASDTTTGLMYTLGACYCFLGFWCLLSLVHFLVLLFFKQQINLNQQCKGSCLFSFTNTKKKCHFNAICLYWFFLDFMCFSSCLHVPLSKRYLIFFFKLLISINFFIIIGRFEDEPIAYFVVFEIPTFLLFSVLVYAIYAFKRIVYKKGFFPKDEAKKILIFGWIFVWGLWLIVTLVYSEAIVGLIFF